VFHFVYDTIGTVGTIIARLADVDNGGWAGVMMRESLAPNAKTILFKTRLYNPNVIIRLPGLITLNCQGNKKPEMNLQKLK
jgi:hypothetical protein